MLLDIVKEYFRHYKIEFIISSLLVGMYIYGAYLFGCAYQLDNNTEVYGVCTQLAAYEMGRDTINFSMPYAIAPVRIERVESCPVCKTCECKPCELGTTTTSQSTTSTTILQECNCPLCPKIENIDYQDIKNGRPPLSCSSSECQRGYFIHKRECIVDVGLKPSKFREGPGVSVNDVAHADKTQKVVFDLINGEFYVNKTWDIKDGVDMWIVRSHVNTLNNTWENGSYKPPI